MEADGYGEEMYKRLAVVEKEVGRLAAMWERERGRQLGC